MRFLSYTYFVYENKGSDNTPPRRYPGLHILTEVDVLAIEFHPPGILKFPFMTLSPGASRTLGDTSLCPTRTSCSGVRGQLGMARPPNYYPQ